VVGGNNIKIGDPAFFPDSLTVEVSSVAASPEDHSVAEAKSLVTALKKQDRFDFALYGTGFLL
jgi:hypothetical protein